MDRIICAFNSVYVGPNIIHPFPSFSALTQSKLYSLLKELHTGNFTHTPSVRITDDHPPDWLAGAFLEVCKPTLYSSLKEDVEYDAILRSVATDGWYDRYKDTFRNRVVRLITPPTFLIPHLEKAGLRVDVDYQFGIKDEYVPPSDKYTSLQSAPRENGNSTSPCRTALGDAPDSRASGDSPKASGDQASGDSPKASGDQAPAASGSDPQASVDMSSLGHDETEETSSYGEETSDTRTLKRIKPPRKITSGRGVKRFHVHIRCKICGMSNRKAVCTACYMARKRGMHTNTLIRAAIRKSRGVWVWPHPWVPIPQTDELSFMCVVCDAPGSGKGIKLCDECKRYAYDEHTSLMEVAIARKSDFRHK